MLTYVDALRHPHESFPQPPMSHCMCSLRPRLAAEGRTHVLGWAAVTRRDPYPMCTTARHSMYIHGRTMGVACRGVACGTYSVAVRVASIQRIYVYIYIYIDGWDWCGRHGGAFIWPVAGGDKPLAVAARPLAPARRAPPSSPVERVPIGHSQCTGHCALPPEYSPHIYIPVVTFFLRQDLSSSPSKYWPVLVIKKYTGLYLSVHCIVHVPAYIRTGREVYTVRWYSTKAIRQYGMLLVCGPACCAMG